MPLSRCFGCGQSIAMRAEGYFALAMAAWALLAAS